MCYYNLLRASLHLAGKYYYYMYSYQEWEPWNCVICHEY